MIPRRMVALVIAALAIAALFPQSSGPGHLSNFVAGSTSSSVVVAHADDGDATATLTADAAAQATATAQAQATAAQQTADAAAQATAAQQTADAAAQATATAQAAATAQAQATAAQQTVVAQATAARQTQIAAQQTQGAQLLQTAVAAYQTGVAQTAAAQTAAVKTAVAQRTVSAEETAAAQTAAAQTVSAQQTAAATQSQPGGSSAFTPTPTSRTDSGTAGNTSPPVVIIGSTTGGTTSSSGNTTTTTSNPSTTSGGTSTTSPTATAIVAPASTPVLLVSTVKKGGQPPIIPASPRKVPTSPSPRLQVTVLTPLVRPGDVEHIAVSYLAAALVQARITFPGQRTISLINKTDKHGQLTFSLTVPRTIALHNGRARASVVVRAAVGPFQQLAQLAPVLRAGVTEHLNVASTPNTYVYTVVTPPGQHPASALSLTDSRGHLALTVTVPQGAQYAGTGATHIAIWAISAKSFAQTSSTLDVSDMVVTVTVSPIVSCTQTQSVHVAYLPRKPLQIVLRFSQGRTLTLKVLTDKGGSATSRLRLNFVKAVSPVHIALQVIDASPHSPRTESGTFSIPLPKACSKIAR